MWSRIVALPLADQIALGIRVGCVIALVVIFLLTKMREDRENDLDHRQKRKKDG